MSKPEAGPGGPALPVRVQLMADLGACLTQWHRATAQGARPVHPNLTWLRGLSIELQPRLGKAGFAAVALHLGELVRRLDAGGAAGDVREPLGALFRIAEQARRSLSAQEQSMLARAFGSSPPVPAAGSSSASPAPAAGFAVSPVQKIVMSQPPLAAGTVRISGDAAASLRPTGASSSTPPPVQEPVRVPLPPPPPALYQEAVRAPARRPSAAPVQEPVRVPLPPPPAVWEPPAGPAPGQAGLRASPSAPMPVAGTPAAAPGSNPPMQRASGGQPAAVAVPSPSPSMNVMASVRPVKPADAPGALRTMFGLRAFSARPSTPASARVRQDAAPLLGLEHRGPAPSALGGGSAGRARKMQDLLGRVGRSRTDSQGRGLGSLALSLKAQRKLQAWRVGAMAAAALVLLGLATAIIVFKRRADESERARLASIAAARKSTKADAGAPAELPQTRLLDADETYRALLTQVHGRGKESPELRALVDEQAALAVRKCEGSSAACQQWAKIRESLVGDGAVKRFTRRRATGSLDRINSSWMLGLKMPEIHIENDPLVQRQFEYYTVGTVGRELFQAMLFRCGAYRDLIEATLIRYGLPLDLIAIVFTESGCEPQAVSPVGAAGLWQFMPETARAYHLRVKEGVIDERRSPPKSTEAAVRFLRDLHDKLVVYNKDGVWDLVFGAFNLGPFAMAARAERAGGDVGFWDLVDAEMLPDETVHYTPTVQAVALILNNLQKLKFAGVQMRSPQLTSDLEVPAGTRLSLIARAASTSVNQVRSMNLDISGDRTPAIPNFAVQVPKDVVFQAGDTLKALISAKDDSDLCVPPSFDWGRELFSDEMARACQRKLGRKPGPK